VNPANNAVESCRLWWSFMTAKHWLWRWRERRPRHRDATYLTLSNTLKYLRCYEPWHLPCRHPAWNAQPQIASLGESFCALQWRLMVSHSHDLWKGCCVWRSNLGSGMRSFMVELKRIIEAVLLESHRSSCLIYEDQILSSLPLNYPWIIRLSEKVSTHTPESTRQPGTE
jgi:hypothetical protein